MVKGFTAIEELKQRLRDMGTLSDSRTPQDALEYIEQLEYNNMQYALEIISSLGQAQEAYEAGWNGCINDITEGVVSEWVEIHKDDLEEMKL